MKPHSVTLTLLDLIFSLFAAATALNLVLAIAKGRTDHRLERDFILVRVEWHAGADPAAIRAEVVTLTSAAEKDVLPWTFVNTPDVHARGTAAESLFFAAPVPSGTWHLRTRLKVAAVTYATRTGSRRVSGLGPEHRLLITTESEP